MNLYFTAEQDAIVNLNIPGLSYTAPPITVLANTVTTFNYLMLSVANMLNYIKKVSLIKAFILLAMCQL